MTASSPMSVQGQPAVIGTATTQTPKPIIPAEIRNESTVSMIGPPFFARRWGRRARVIEASGPPAAQNRDAHTGMLCRRPTGRDLRPTNAAGRSCRVCGALREFNARRLHAGAVTRGSGTAGGDSKPTAPVAQSRTPMGDAGGLPTRPRANERNEPELRSVRGKGEI
jgi:hypothetical protein